MLPLLLLSCFTLLVWLVAQTSSTQLCRPLLLQGARGLWFTQILSTSCLPRLVPLLVLLLMLVLLLLAYQTCTSLLVSGTVRCTAARTAPTCPITGTSSTTARCLAGTCRRLSTGSRGSSSRTPGAIFTTGVCSYPASTSIHP